MADLTSVFQETISRHPRREGVLGGGQFAAQLASSAETRERTSSSVVRMEADRRTRGASPMAEMMGAVGAVIVLWAGGNQVLEGQGHVGDRGS